jgi:ABC-type uncharacterized transport system ATPase subunit
MVRDALLSFLKEDSERRQATILCQSTGSAILSTLE